MKKINKTFFKQNFPVRKKNAYKNQSGKVLIVAGSKNMPGAAILCARAAYRAGAGFVTLAVPEALYKAAVNAVPEALILALPQTRGYLNAASLKTILHYLKQNAHDALLTGPGLGKGADITLNLLNKTRLPAVIDADSLNFLAKNNAGKIDKNIPYILTPHTGEIKRLLHKTEINPQTAANELYKLSGAVSLLKGPATKVSYGNDTYENTTGNEGLAKAGSGDALGGVIAAIFAQLLKRGAQNAALKAACLGVYLHGAAADDAVEKISKTSLTASDVCARLPFTLKQILG
jgi:NAD(P)H-hydrate epimerase